MLLLRTLFTLVAFLLPELSLAHEDELLNLQDDGRILGLPDAFGELSLVIDTSKDRWNVVLRRDAQERRLPRCLVQFFENASEPPLVSGSWHPDLKVIPPYLAISLVQKTGRPDKALGADLAFSLKSLDLVFFERPVPNPAGSGSITSMNDLEKVCLPDEIEMLKPRPAV